VSRRPLGQAVLPALALTLAVALPGCGGGSASSGQDDPTLTDPTGSQGSGQADQGPSLTTCVNAPSTARAPAAAPTDLATRPVVEVPDASPPCGLQTSDIVTGKGTAAKEGDKLAVRYVGVNYADGKEFDASWNRGRQTFSFGLGAGDVIAGWDRGIAGMKVGGRRQLTIPPDLGYGQTGSPPEIPGGATLVFVVDLVRVG